MGQSAHDLRPFAGHSQSRQAAAVARLLGMGGIRLNGQAPWDIQVRNPAFFGEVLVRGSLGLGESYVAGHWECERLDELFDRLLRANVDEKIAGIARLRLWAEALRARLLNLQSSGRAFQVGRRHYDLGNDLFEAMLDPEMAYSCGYWAGTDSLAQAQRAKLDMACRKLELQPGESLLDIGCGWGSMAAWAARHYGAQVTGITVSGEQQRLAAERCRGLPVRFELRDYRDLPGRYDKVVSIGMFEHVGPRNYRTYFGVASRALEDQGLFLLHTIGNHVTSRSTDAWIERYIFPNGAIPSAPQITNAIEGLFVIEDWHNFGPDYDRTLLAWHRNFELAWPRLASRYGERFRRLWRYYLLSCAGFFRSRQGQLWQIVLSKPGRSAPYRSYRPA